MAAILVSATDGRRASSVAAATETTSEPQVKDSPANGGNDTKMNFESSVWASVNNCLSTGFLSNYLILNAGMNWRSSFLVLQNQGIQFLISLLISKLN